MVVDEEAVYMVSEVAVGMATSVLSCSVWFVIMITRVVPSLVPRLISHIASDKSLGTRLGCTNFLLTVKQGHPITLGAIK